VTLPFLPPVGIGLLALAFGVLWFHRDPDRSTPDAEGIVVAPADGTVSVVRKEGERLRVGVFMNVTDVHVNRAPLAGEVREVRHRPGANRPAFDKESDRNEQVAIDFGEYELLVIARLVRSPDPSLGRARRCRRPRRARGPRLVRLAGGQT